MEATTAESIRNQLLIPIVTLNIGALLLVAGAVYLVKTLSINYGIGVGIIAQALTSNTAVPASLQSTVLQLPALRNGIYESYTILLIALVILGSAFVMFLRRRERTAQTARRYTLLNVAFTAIFTLFLFIVMSGFQGYFIDPVYLYAVYFGIGLCFISDGLIELEIRKPVVRTARQQGMKTLAIDPSKPFTNAVNIQDQLFGNMAGSLRVIDKHFNSAALMNFHRLVDRNITNFNSISILTSKEMMDNDLAGNLNDFRNEITEMGVALEVRLLDDKDAIDQHERMIMDDRTAYKIPPFNIINKKSEHITKINLDEANKRFIYLYGRAIKLDNYAVKKGRGEQSV